MLLSFSFLSKNQVPVFFFSLSGASLLLTFIVAEQCVSCLDSSESVMSIYPIYHLRDCRVVLLSALDHLLCRFLSCVVCTIYWHRGLMKEENKVEQTLPMLSCLDIVCLAS